MSDLIIKNNVAFVKNEGIEKAIDTGNKNAVLEIAMNITAQAKYFAPVRKTSGGGRLRNSIMWAVKEKIGGLNNSDGQQHDMQIDVSPKEFEGFVGCHLDYAVYQEFGTRKMPPQPFLRPAVAAVVNGDVFETIKEKVEADIEAWYESGMKRETTFF
jgi:HK97 gp10 family phage protein